MEKETEEEFKSILRPSIEELDIFLDGDWRDRPASMWAVKSSGTLQAKIERFRRDNAHRRPGFLSKTDEVPYHAIVSFANIAYGYNGWSTEVVESKVVLESEESERYSVTIETTVRVTLKDGTYHEASGKGLSQNLPHRHMAYSKAKKESVTAATKRCIQGFGDLVLDHESKIKKGYYKGGMFEA